MEEARARLQDEALQGRLEALLGEPGPKAVLACVFGNSPFLTDCILADIAYFVRLIESGPEESLKEAWAEMDDALCEAREQKAAMRALRQAKRRTALGAGLADIAGGWGVDEVTAALSDFAARALDGALATLLHHLHERGELELPDPDKRLDDCGYVLLGMGKLGARELNYSSDIDLIALYDPEKAPLTGKRHHQDLFVRLTRDLARLIDERTGDGYVFRTDFRLRPDPAVTPLAVTFAAAEAYYESTGQNWERAAMIKARPVAGDKGLGDEFLEMLRPFVWRRNLDFWAIQDVHSIKRQIQATKGGSVVAVEGHNIKLGRGGIREIEFFAQTQQLIYGGRDPDLREPRTVEALSALAETGWIKPAVAEELSTAYRYLRRLEHRLQMVEDKQTQRLPDRPEGIAHIAAFMGYEGPEAFREELLKTLRCVESHYAELFEEAPELSGPGNLVFTGGEADPTTLETLETMGFADGQRVYNLVKGWHHGRYRALRTTRSRQILTEIMPALLTALSETPQPDAAIVKLDEFLANLPAGVQLFAMLYQNPSLLTLLAEVLGTAPALAEILSRRPDLLEAVVSGDFFAAPPDKATLADELDEVLGQARDFQDVLDLSRRWVNERKFQIGIQILRQTSALETCQRALSDIADVTIAALYPHVEDQLAEVHGRPPDGGMAILALGKLGAREMTPTSDLDLVFLYDSDGDPATDGEKPLATSQYYARLGQRLITALSAMTGEGRLYEIDMRLRPSGNAGPLAQSLSGFKRYQSENAWTWEHMALSRARVVLAPDDLRAAVEETVTAVLTQNRDSEDLIAAVADMRQRIDKQHKAPTPWSFKHRRGGIVDLEFIAQTLLLQNARAHPEILTGNTAEAFQRLGKIGALDQEEAESLAAAARLYQSIQSLLRLTVGRQFDPESAPVGLKKALAEAGGSVDFESLEQTLNDTCAYVLERFRHWVGEPGTAQAI